MAPALGAVSDSDPPSTASRLKGNVEVVREANGGSIRENGADTRRFLLIPAIFLFGERPAGAVKGVRAVAVLAFTGVENREGKAEGGGMDLVEVRVKVKAFSATPLLLFLVGESNTAGSTFSLSKSSKEAASKARLLEDDTLFTMLDFPFKDDVDFCVSAPKHYNVSTCTRRYNQRVWHTILAVFSIREVLQTRVVERCKWHAGSVRGHGEMSDERVRRVLFSMAWSCLLG